MKIINLFRIEVPWHKFHLFEQASMMAEGHWLSSKETFLHHQQLHYDQEETEATL